MKDKAVSGLGSCLGKTGRYEAWGSLGNGVVVQSQEGEEQGEEREEERNWQGVDTPAQESSLCKYMYFICVMYTYFICVMYM